MGLRARQAAALEPEVLRAPPLLRDHRAEVERLPEPARREVAPEGRPELRFRVHGGSASRPRREPVGRRQQRPGASVLTTGAPPRGRPPTAEVALFACPAGRGVWPTRPL